MTEGKLFDELKEKLLALGINLNQKTPEEILKIIRKNEDFNSTLELFVSFIKLMKSNNRSIMDIVEKNNRSQDSYQRQRNALFIKIIIPLFEGYEKLLDERNEIDFSDMINKASVYINDGKLNRRISYVLIDEFQDISIGRYNLVKAIKNTNANCKLFCVGDDWQSIYRFTGSDMALFKDFDKYFGYTERFKLETTYRFNHPLIGLTSNFILKNPAQERKNLTGSKTTQTTDWEIIYSDSRDDDTIALKKVFDKLIAVKKNIESKSIYILGRYNFDIGRIKNLNGIFNIDKNSKKVTYTARTNADEMKEVTAKFLTIHSAKGLEADIAIIINCNSGKYGLPSGKLDDLALNLPVSEADQFKYGEERRLFYVAATRAKENVFFIASRPFRSEFINELEEYKIRHK